MNFWSILIWVTLTAINFVLSFLPQANPAHVAKISEQLQPLKTTVASAGWFFPVSDFFTILGIVFTIESFLFLYKFVKFIVKNVSMGFIRD